MALCLSVTATRGSGGGIRGYCKQSFWLLQAFEKRLEVSLSASWPRLFQIQGLLKRVGLRSVGVAARNLPALLEIERCWSLLLLSGDV